MCHYETVFKCSCQQRPIVSADQKQTIQGLPEKFVIQMREMFEEANKLCVWRGEEVTLARSRGWSLKLRQNLLNHTRKERTQQALF